MLTTPDIGLVQAIGLSYGQVKGYLSRAGRVSSFFTADAGNWRGIAIQPSTPDLLITDIELGIQHRYFDNTSNIVQDTTALIIIKEIAAFEGQPAPVVALYNRQNTGSALSVLGIAQVETTVAPHFEADLLTVIKGSDGPIVPGCMYRLDTTKIFWIGLIALTPLIAPNAPSYSLSFTVIRPPDGPDTIQD